MYNHNLKMEKMKTKIDFVGNNENISAQEIARFQGKKTRSWIVVANLALAGIFLIAFSHVFINRFLHGERNPLVLSKFYLSFIIKWFRIHATR